MIPAFIAGILFGWFLCRVRWGPVIEEWVTKDEEEGP